MSLPRSPLPNPGLVELETDFDDEEDEDLEAGAPVTGLVEEEEVTEEEEYDFTPLYVESEDHDLQELEEETLDQEVAAGRRDRRYGARCASRSAY